MVLSAQCSLLNLVSDRSTLMLPYNPNPTIRLFGRDLPDHDAFADSWLLRRRRISELHWVWKRGLIV